MNRADRYLGAAVLGGIALCWGVLAGLMVLFALLGEMADVGRRGYGFADALAYVALTAPRRAGEVLPAAALIGSALGLGTLARAGELTALRAAGVSLARMARATALAAVPVLGAGLVVSEGLAPGLEARAEALRAQAQGRPALAGTGGGFWHRAGGVVLHVAQVPGAGEIAHIEAWEFNDRRELVRVVRAPSGTRQRGGWVLHDATLTELSDTAIRGARVARLPAPFVPDPAALVISRTEPEHLGLAELRHQARLLEANGRAAQRYRLALWKKLGAPLTTLVLVLLGLPLVLASGRTLGLGQRLFTAVVVGLVFYLLDQAFGYGALAYGLALPVAALLPTALAAVLGWFSLRQAARV